jgi:hypothetical protein
MKAAFAHHRAYHRIQTGTIAPACQYTDLHRFSCRMNL